MADPFGFCVRKAAVSSLILIRCTSRSDDSPIETIGVGAYYDLTFEKEYERMNSSLKPSAANNPPTVEKNRADPCGPTAKLSESINAKPSTIHSADLANGSSPLPEQSTNEKQSNENRPTIKQEPKGIPSFATLLKNSKPPTSQTNFEKSGKESGRESIRQAQKSKQLPSDSSAGRACSPQPTKKLKPGPICIVLE